MQFDFATSLILIAILSALLGAIIGKIDREKIFENQKYTHQITPKNQNIDKYD